MRHLLFAFFFFSALAGFGQHEKPAEPSVYQATPERINNLVHTKLDAKLRLPETAIKR
jgi:hypothetical protein